METFHNSILMRLYEVRCPIIYIYCYPDHEYDVKNGTNTVRSIVADVTRTAGFSASICRVLVRRMRCPMYLVLNFPKR